MKLILIALLSLSSSLAFAGPSATDPVVASLRQRFSKAFVPSDSQLNLDKKWKCRFFDAEAGNSDTQVGFILLKPFDGLYVMEGEYPYLDKTYVRTSRGLVSAKMSGESIATQIFRVDEKNNLLIESAWTTSNKKSLNESFKTYEKALGAEGSLASGYSVCVKYVEPKK